MVRPFKVNFEFWPTIFLPFDSTSDCWLNKWTANLLNNCFEAGKHLRLYSLSSISFFVVFAVHKRVVKQNILSPSHFKCLLYISHQFTGIPGATQCTQEVVDSLQGSHFEFRLVNQWTMEIFFGKWKKLNFFPFPQLVAVVKSRWKAKVIWSPIFYVIIRKIH